MESNSILRGAAVVRSSTSRISAALVRTSRISGGGQQRTDVGSWDDSSVFPPAGKRWANRQQATTKEETGA